jgi:hypothetical protein
MIVLVRIAVGILLLAHGLVHLLYLAPGVREFSLDRSWRVPAAARRPVAVFLMAATVAAFALLALAVWHVPGLSAIWPTVTVVGCLLSVLLLGLFWNTALVLGLAVDLALLAVAILRPPWAQQFVGGSA